MGKSNIKNGRYTIEKKEPFVVFIIGMRINRFLAFSKWLPTAKAMGPMIKELYQHPELGFLDCEIAFNLRGVTMVQYWRSFEDLERYAKEELHLEAWKRFNRSIGSDGTVGIFHETYEIKLGQYECIYANMPAFGLGKTGEVVPAVGRRKTAQRRIHKESID
ncbi:MAG TPA: DUF4188 domain-containing protein [Bacillales bacterium]